MKLYCRKTIHKVDGDIEREEAVDENFDEIVSSKIGKIRKQICELKVVKKTNKSRYDEIIDEIDNILEEYPSKQRIKKEWKLYGNTFKIDINNKEKTLKVKKDLPFWDYTSNRYYFHK